MKKKNRKSLHASEYLRWFQKIEPFVRKRTIGNLNKKTFYSLCLKASLAKCFEFNLLAHGKRSYKDAFFWLPALRGICEELIVLNFIKSLPAVDRQRLIPLLMEHEMLSKIHQQTQFFSRTRPQQTILSMTDLTEIGGIEGNIRSIWNRNGWSKLAHGTMPQIRQIAEKQGLPVLAMLYDYLYRLTSGTVHFNAQTLLRMGWGDLRKKRFRYSTKNFYGYYLMFARVYGAFLFCVYFEFFSKYFRPDKHVSEIINNIRKEVIMSPRWPEMVTFEEMNIRPPKTSPLRAILYSFMQTEKIRRLIS